jgi:hypothetical protein
MTHSKSLVVSNYNWDLELLKEIHSYGFSSENIFIYNFFETWKKS